jgi:hypothetical protein
VQDHTITANARAVAEQWVAGTNATVVQASYVGSELMVLIADLDDLPDDDLLARLAGRVPSGTVVVVDRVSGERTDLGAVP